LSDSSTFLAFQGNSETQHPESLLVAADSENSSFDLDQELEQLLRQKKKISAIILYQKHTMSSLAEAKNYVDELESKMNFTNFSKI
jgi:ribosomal protein L7/L12